MALPAKTFARKIVSMSGYSANEMVTEVASIDGVDRVEAARRVKVALEQRTRRSVAQQVRGMRQRDALESLRWSVLCRCEVARTQAHGAYKDLVEIDESLLRELAWEYKDAVRATDAPASEWVREQVIEHLNREGLIVRGTMGMRITDDGLAFIKNRI